jgi:folate-binding protein YgfZ
VNRPAALGFGDTYEACRSGVAGMVVGIDVVRVTGRDARSYLQTQCSQDLAGLVPGASVESLVLSPQGKVDAYVRVALLAEEEVLVVVAAGNGGALHERLRRFRLRVKADLEALQWQCAVLRGPAAVAAAAGAGAIAALPLEWPPMTGVDLIAPEVGLPEGVPEGDPRAFETIRIEAGEPVMGREINERTIAQEAGLVARAVSFTKGCYPGQELVARIDARGDNVPKRLRGVVVGSRDPDATAPDPTLVTPGAKIFAGGREVGALTSVAWSPRLGAVVALAYVRREVSPPAPATLETDGAGPLTVKVVELPIA